MIRVGCSSTGFLLDILCNTVCKKDVEADVYVGFFRLESEYHAWYLRTYLDRDRNKYIGKKRIYLGIFF